MSDRLMNGEKLERGQSLTSRNGAYTLTLQDDGNLVLTECGEAVWATGTRAAGSADIHGGLRRHPVGDLGTLLR